jgi:predicted ATP-binding protein involved in virulence
MQFQSVQLLNYRCFRDRTVHFSPDFNVIAGSNGSGKTSLLKGVAEALWGLVNFIPNAHPSIPLSKESDVRLEIVRQNGRYRFERCFPVAIRSRATALGETVEWTVSKQSGLEAAQIEGRPPGMVVIGQHPPSISEPVALNTQFTLPVIAFYTANRYWCDAEPSEMVAATQRSSRTDAYAMWWNASAASNHLQTWAISKSQERNQLAADAGKKSDNVDDDELALVNGALEVALDGARGLKYDFAQKSLLVEWDIRAAPDRPATLFADLSDGQRAIVGLVADIARRMCLLNPHLGQEVTSKTPGVVLIDELDVHLHPRWQRIIPHALRKAFPSVQFITASHSPQILGEVEPAQIVLLTASGTAHPRASYGLDSSRVLEEIMDADQRPAKVTKLLDDVYEAIERGDLDAARRDKGQLEKLSPDLPELHRIDALLTRKAHSVR